MGISKIDSARQLTKGAVLSRAVLGAADRLGLTARQLSQVLGLSEATVSRMKKSTFKLEQETKPYELAALLVRIFRSLDAIVGGEDKVLRSWMRSENLAIGGKPLDKILKISGMIEVLTYLDARRAII